MCDERQIERANLNEIIAAIEAEHGVASPDQINALREAVLQVRAANQAAFKILDQARE